MLDLLNETAILFNYPMKPDREIEIGPVFITVILLIIIVLAAQYARGMVGKPKIVIPQPSQAWLDRHGGMDVRGIGQFEPVTGDDDGREPTK